MHYNIHNQVNASSEYVYLKNDIKYDIINVIITIIITYYHLNLYDIQVCDLQMEINQASGDQSV